MLCSALGDCKIDFTEVTSNCSLSTVHNNTILVPGGRLDLCTVEGTSNGANLTLYSTMANNTNACNPQIGCNNPDYMCSMVGKRTTRCSCSAQNGSETCTSYGECTLTPCATCNRYDSAWWQFCLLTKRLWGITTAKASPSFSKVFTPAANSKCMVICFI